MLGMAHASSKIATEKATAYFRTNSYRAMAYSGRFTIGQNNLCANAPTINKRSATVKTAVKTLVDEIPIAIDRKTLRGPWVGQYKTGVIRTTVGITLRLTHYRADLKRAKTAP